MITTEIVTNELYLVEFALIAFVIAIILQIAYRNMR